MKLTQHVFKNVFGLKSVHVFFLILAFKHFQGKHFSHHVVCIKMTSDHLRHKQHQIQKGQMFLV